MKNAIRIISILLMAVMVSVVLCSCIQLDEAKNNRAIWLDDEKTEVQFRDHLYKIIMLKGDVIIKNIRYNGHLTEADVPILLADSVGNSMYFDAMQDIPIIIKDAPSYNTNGVRFYCLESEYDRIFEINANQQYDSMYIEYDKPFVNGDMVGYNYDYLTEYEIVSEEYQDAIDRTLNSNDETILDEIDYDEVYNLDVVRCDSEMILTNHDTIHIEYIDNEYYVQERTKGLCKKASETDKEIFKKLFAEYDEKGAVYDAFRPEGYIGY